MKPATKAFRRLLSLERIDTMNSYPNGLMAAVCILSFATTATFSASAHHRPGHNPPGHAKKYEKSHKVKRGGPPAWAPAWGYRNKRKVRYEHAGVVHEAQGGDLVRVPETGMGRCNRDVIGAILGGAIGAAAGSQIGKGDGRKLATVGGAIIGVLVGGNLGRAMDQVDQNCVGQVLERTPTGRTVVWKNPDQNGQYKVTPTRTYQNRAGTYCREYQTQVVIGGKLENAWGVACRQPDGTWKRG